MPHLLIKCSECRAIVDTGVSMEEKDFCKAKLEDKKLKCHNCETDQTLRKEDVLALSFC